MRRWLLGFVVVALAGGAAFAQADTLAHKAALYDALFGGDPYAVLCL